MRRLSSKRYSGSIGERKKIETSWKYHDGIYILGDCVSFRRWRVCSSPLQTIRSKEHFLFLLSPNICRKRMLTTPHPHPILFMRFTPVSIPILYMQLHTYRGLYACLPALNFHGLQLYIKLYKCPIQNWHHMYVVWRMFGSVLVNSHL